MRRSRRRMSKLVVGDSLDKGIDMGALVDQAQLKTSQIMVELGVEEGGRSGSRM